jgi:transcription initiation factor TFIID subunit 5
MTEKPSSSGPAATEMSSLAGRSAANLQPPRPLTQADAVNKKVIEYLVKKGYMRTEQTLRQESAHLDKDGRPIHNHIEELGNIKYTRGYKLLCGWIDQNLDLYKASCILQETFSHLIY